jgi:hypothetical protein
MLRKRTLRYNNQLLPLVNPRWIPIQRISPLKLRRMPKIKLRERWQTRKSKMVELKLKTLNKVAGLKLRKQNRSQPIFTDTG